MDALKLLGIICICSICAILLNHILGIEKMSYRAKISCMKKLMSMWMGISITIWCQLIIRQPNSGFAVLRYMESDGTLTNQSIHTTQLHLDKRPTIFISTTDYSVTQIASLTTTAQALFPARDKVKWIIVALPLESSQDHGQVVNSKSGETFSEAITGLEGVTKRYFQTLQSTLNRFGVPYILLHSYPDDAQFDTAWGGYTWRKTSDRILRGYQTGILWALKNLSRALIVLGDNEFVYNSALFSELRNSNVASCWAVGFSVDDTSIATPIFTLEVNENINETQKPIVGYDNGNDVVLGSMPIERGAFAIDLDYLRTHVPYQDLWKLSFDGKYTNFDLKINLKDIRIMGQQGTEVYVWRTETSQKSWPNYIRSTRMHENNNLNRLLKSAFGPRFYLMPELVVNIESTKHFDDYDLKDALSYMK